MTRKEVFTACTEKTKGMVHKLKNLIGVITGWNYEDIDFIIELREQAYETGQTAYEAGQTVSLQKILSYYEKVPEASVVINELKTGIIINLFENSVLEGYSNDQASSKMYDMFMESEFPFTDKGFSDFIIKRSKENDKRGAI
jgi:hypothetical protein